MGLLHDRLCGCAWCCHSRDTIPISAVIIASDYTPTTRNYAVVDGLRCAFEVAGVGQIDSTTARGEGRFSPFAQVAFSAVGLHLGVIGGNGTEACDGIGRCVYRNCCPFAVRVLLVHDVPSVLAYFACCP